MGADNTFGETNFNPNSPAEGAKAILLKHCKENKVFLTSNELHTILDAMTEFAAQQPTAEGAEEILPQFGDYCTIEMKRHGCANEHYTHKVIGTLRSNSWVDVPVQSPATETNHVVKELEPVVACVCEGIAEREILRYRISDIRNLKKPATLHAQRIAEKMVEERLREELIDFGHAMFPDESLQNIKHYVDTHLKSREP